MTPIAYNVTHCVLMAALIKQPLSNVPFSVHSKVINSVYTHINLIGPCTGMASLLLYLPFMSLFMDSRFVKHYYECTDKIIRFCCLNLTFIRRYGALRIIEYFKEFILFKIE